MGLQPLVPTFGEHLDLLSCLLGVKITAANRIAASFTFTMKTIKG